MWERRRKIIVLDFVEIKTENEALQKVNYWIFIDALHNHYSKVKYDAACCVLEL